MTKNEARMHIRLSKKLKERVLDKAKQADVPISQWVRKVFEKAVQI